MFASSSFQSKRSTICCSQWCFEWCCDGVLSKRLDCDVRLVEVDRGKYSLYHSLSINLYDIIQASSTFLIDLSIFRPSTSNW